MKKAVKVGDRVQIIFMNDTWTQLKAGDKGTVFKVEKSSDEILIWVDWDNGEQLALLEGIDEFKIVKQ
jgi:cytoskeletal protein RodZ